jgi:hypothetical protein
MEFGDSHKAVDDVGATVAVQTHGPSSRGPAPALQDWATGWDSKPEPPLVYQ